jgi:hypothetical protein
VHSVLNSFSGAHWNFTTFFSASQHQQALKQQADLKQGEACSVNPEVITQLTAKRKGL